MLDLDDFKSINDTYGHEIGDQALIETANILLNAVAGYGKVVRYAGDEFVIVMNSAKQSDVDAVVNGIKNGIADFNRTHKGGYQLSASIGAHIFDRKGQSVDEFLNVIDSKMYEAKNEYHGRSRKE